MADRYWVGGSGDWTSTSTTNWSATDGGAGGASVPGAADDVYITPLSNGVAGNYRIRLFVSPTIRSITVQGASQEARPWLFGTTTRTITASAACSFQNVDLTGIQVVGATVTTNFVGSRNQGVGGSFVPTSAQKTVYRVSTGWAFSSGGIPDADAFPLPQDTAVVDDLSGSATLDLAGSTLAGFPIGVLSMLTRSTPFTVRVDNTFLYNSWFASSSISYATNSGDLYVAGSGVQQFFSGGSVFYGRLRVFDGVQPVLWLMDSFTSTQNILFPSGELHAKNGSNVTVPAVQTLSGLFKAVYFGSGTWTLTGSGAIFSDAGDNAFAFPETCTVVISDQTSATKSFYGRTATFPKIVIADSPVSSTYFFSITNAITLQKDPNRTTGFTLELGTSMSVQNWLIYGSPTGTVALTGGASAKTLTYTGAGVVSSEYLSVQNINALPAGRWYAGNVSQNLGGNTGWVFSSYPGGVMVAIF